MGRAGIEGLETCREISGLPGPSSAKFGFRGGRMLHNSDKEFALTMGGGCGMLEGGRHGAGERYKEPEGGREAGFTDNIPKRTHKNLQGLKQGRDLDQTRSRSHICECEKSLLQSAIL